MKYVNEITKLQATDTCTIPQIVSRIMLAEQDFHQMLNKVVLL